MNIDEIKDKIKQRIIYHADEKKYRYEIGKGVIDALAEDILKELQISELKSRAEKAEARAEAAVKDLYDACKYTPCNAGICVNKNCKGNVIPCDFKWRGEVENKNGK